MQQPTRAMDILFMSPGTMQCENNSDGKCASPFAASSSTSLGNRCTLNVTSSKSRTQCQADATHKECFLQSRFSVVIEKLVSGYGHLVAYRECCTQLATISGNAMRHTSGEGHRSTIFPCLHALRQVPILRGKKKASLQLAQ